jgi:peroxiredoxin
MTPPVLKAQAMNPQLTNPLAGEMAAVLASYHTESGRTLLGLVDESPVLLIFLRHFGCSFCRQTLDDVSQIRAQIEGRGVRPVFVHLGTPERAKPYFDYYHLPDIERISDPEEECFYPVPDSWGVEGVAAGRGWQAWHRDDSGRCEPDAGGVLPEGAGDCPGVPVQDDRGSSGLSEADWLNFCGRQTSHYERIAGAD